MLRNVSMTVRENEIVAVVGNSGSGKTTLLRVIAGFEGVDDGEVWIGDRVMTTRKHTVPPAERRIGYIFQEHALFPHLTVRKNVEFGLRHRSARHTREITDELLGMLQITEIADRYPHEISGGQTQRVGIARALAPKPRILLLDEPFNNLDVALREAILPDLHAIIKQHNIAALCITHLPQEAFMLADRIAVLDRKHIAQTAEPRELYRRPINRDIAQFFGLINCIPAHYSHRERLIYMSDRIFCAPPPGIPLPPTQDAEVEILLRPDEMELFFDLSAQECKRTDLLLLHGEIVQKKYFGHFQLLKIRIIEPNISTECIVHVTPDTPARNGQRVLVGLPMGTMHIVVS